MKNIVALFLVFFSFFSTFAQRTFHVQNEDATTLPVSEDLFGSFFEIGFGRSDLLWGELLFNRDFEMSKPLAERNPWLAYSRASKELEDWWHSGYEEPKWYIAQEGGEKNYKIPAVYCNYWPAAHGKHFVDLNNKSKDRALLLAQDRVYIRKNVGYHFSGLFSTKYFFSGNKYRDEAKKVFINIYPEGNFSQPVQSVALDVKTNQFGMHHLDLQPMDYEGWCTFAICLPPSQDVAVDLVSLSAADDVRGWKKAAVEMIKNQLQPKSLRFPGGCFASLYDWRDGVGPREMRPFSYDTWWECELLNDVGIVEFVELCEAVGAKPFYCIPMMFGDVNNACELVDFCNNPGNERRKSYGRIAPLNVKYWEFENEPYRRFDPITYAEKSKEFAIKMKKVDPTIKIAVGNYWAFHSKFKEILDIVGPYVDLINNRGGDTKEIAADAKILEAYNKAHGTALKICHTEFRAPLDRAGTEVDGLNQVKNRSKETLFNRSVRWEYAMNMAESYINFQKIGGMFYTANFTNLSDGWGESLINNPKESAPFLSAAGVTYSLLSSLKMAHPQKFTIDSEDQNIVFSPAWNRDRTKLTLVFLNFNKDQKRVVVDLKNVLGKYQKEATVHTIAPESLLTFNSVKSPHNIKVETSTMKAGKKMKIDLKGHSLLAVDIYVK